MKPLHLLRYDDTIRPGKASLEEIRDACNGHGERLAHVTLRDGELVAKPLSDKEMNELRAELDAMTDTAIRTALDHLLAATRTSAGVRGFRSDNFTIVAEEQPRAEAVVRAWAEANGLYVHEREMPSDDVEYWTPAIEVRASKDEWRSIVRLYWPSIKLGEQAVAAEAVSRAVTSLAEKTIGDGEELPF